MAKHALRLGWVVLVALWAIGPAGAGEGDGVDAWQAGGDKPQAAQAVEIKGLTLERRLQIVGTTQTVRGYYSDKSLTLVVDDIERMKVRKRLPAGSYIVLAGALPKGLRFGDRIEARGVITRPGEPARPQDRIGEETVLVVGRATDIKVVERSKQPVYAIPPGLPERIAAGAAKYGVGEPAGMAAAGAGGATHYAVLINGGIDWANNWVSFYNDLVVDYALLRGRGYKPGNIHVLNADGGGATPGTTPCGKIPVDGAANKANVRAIFGELAKKMKAQDTLAVMITDHGGEGVVCLWKEEMKGSELAGLIKALPKCAQMTLAFDLCYAGGLVTQVKGEDRLVFAACDAGESAYDSVHGDFGAMNYALVAALTGVEPGGKKGGASADTGLESRAGGMGVGGASGRGEGAESPQVGVSGTGSGAWGSGGKINADANGDGKVSLAEAFNYVRVHIDASGPQRPHYNDDTAMPDATGKLPVGTDGLLGAKRFL